MNKIFLIIISFGVLTGTAQITIQQGTTDWYPNTIPSMTGDITLEEGATLNIHSGCTLNMPSGSKILIKKNARLHVSGSQITGNNWLGIRCDKGTISGQDRIPYVNISDSELSGASIAFINAEDESSEDWGGAILANNADFKDNIVFLILKNYTYNQKTWE